MPSVSRRGFLGGATGLALAGCGSARAQGVPVIVVMLDQLRSASVGSLGGALVPTPTLDALAAESASFASCYCPDPQCTPSRAAMLSGLYPTVTGVTHADVQLPLLYPTYSEVFRAAGYRCGYVGKWHVDGPGDHVPPGPRRRGFDDYWAAFNKNGHRYTESTYYRDTAQPLHPDPPDTYEPIYQTAQALEFVDQAAGEPFLLVVSYQPPHPPAELTSNLGPWDGWIPASYMDAVDPDALELAPNVPPEWEAAAREFLHGYAAALWSMDDIVATLLDGLRARGVLDDALLIVISDHGELAGAHGLFGKEHPYDEGMRVPWWVRWPGRVAPAVVDTPVAAVDLAPTLLGLLGLPALPRTHGTDLSGLLLGSAAPARPPAFVQARLDEPASIAWEAIRQGDHLYSSTLDGSVVHLHDLAIDPWQLDDLAQLEGYEALRAELAAALAAARTAAS